jgi:hypothetical protein
MQSTGNRRNFCGILEAGKEEKRLEESSFVKTASREKEKDRENKRVIREAGWFPSRLSCSRKLEW